jgi:hypothetical protein
MDAGSNQPNHVPVMRGIPTSQFRAPLFSRAATASSVLAGAVLLTSIAASEAHGMVRYALVGLAALIAVLGLRWVWRAAARDKDCLP